jgi:hypothetical protein
MMVEIDIAVPTKDELSIEFTVDIDDPEFPDGSVIDRDLTAIVGGWPGHPNDEVIGFVFPKTDERMDHNSSTQSAEVYPELTQAVRTAMASYQLSDN